MPQTKPQRSSSGGTQSPPLEATGSHTVMGASSVHTVGQPIEVVPDREQRREYFQDESANDDAQNAKKAGGGQMKTQKLGESMADKFDKMD